MGDIVLIMHYIAEQLTEYNGQLFESGFIGYLQIISVSLFNIHLKIHAISQSFHITQELATDPPTDFNSNFKKITRIMCDLCLDLSANSHLRAKFIGKWLTEWLQCLKCISSQLKYSIFKSAPEKLWVKSNLPTKKKNCSEKHISKNK